MNTLGHHPDEQDRLAGHDPAQVEERVKQIAREHVAGHVLGRRHVLERRVREQFADQLRVRELEQERVRHRGVDLERVAEAELVVGEAGLLAEELVEQLADHYRVRRVDRVRRGEVVVLARVDDDPGARMDLPGEYWSTKVRRVLMSRKMMPYMQSFSIMSRRSRPSSAAISGMQSPEE